MICIACNGFLNNVFYMTCTKNAYENYVEKEEEIQVISIFLLFFPIRYEVRQGKEPFWIVIKVVLDKLVKIRESLHERSWFDPRV